METIYDVAIIGGGVVGCSLVHELTNRGYNCVLIEKEKDLASGATGGNSGITHTGFDADPDTLEGILLKCSWPLVLQRCQDYGITLKTTGAIMIARNEEEMTKLSSLIKQYEKKVIGGGIRLLTANKIQTMEPHLTKDILGGIWIPAEGVIDSNMFTVSLAHHALRRGAKLVLNQEVTKLTNTMGLWTIKTAGGICIKAKSIVNAAGLYGDKLNIMAGTSSKFKISPRRGQFAVYGKETGQYLSSILLPIPTNRTKGIIVYPSPYGNVVVGPTAEDVTEREDPQTQPSVISELTKYASTLIPELKHHAIVGTYAGLRPATLESKDYHIYAETDKNYVVVGGIRSTGQTAGLGIAKHVAEVILPSQLPSLKPSRDAIGIPQHTHASPMVTNKPSYVLDGVEYMVRHPLMKIGLGKSASKL